MTEAEITRLRTYVMSGGNLLLTIGPESDAASPAFKTGLRQGRPPHPHRVTRSVAAARLARAGSPVTLAGRVVGGVQRSTRSPRTVRTAAVRRAAVEPQRRAGRHHDGGVDAGGAAVFLALRAALVLGDMAAVGERALCADLGRVAESAGAAATFVAARRLDADRVVRARCVGAGARVAPLR